MPVFSQIWANIKATSTNVVTQCFRTYMFRWLCDGMVEAPNLWAPHSTNSQEELEDFMAQLVRNVNICPTAANAMPPFAPEFAQHQMRYESQCADTSAFCVEFDATNFRDVGQHLNNRIESNFQI